MNYAVIKKNDVANGVGVRVSVFVSGCRHHCPGCFNREAWDFDYGTPFTPEVLESVVEMAVPEQVDGLSLLGGEPFEPENQAPLLELTTRFRERCPTKSIWCYTGFLYEDIAGGRVGDAQTAKRLLESIDVLVDGKFEASLHDKSLIFRGSSNQRIIDVKRSLERGEVTIASGRWERKMGSGDIDEI